MRAMSLYKLINIYIYIYIYIYKEFLLATINVFGDGKTHINVT